ncbi:DUF2268 domain-containing protein [Rubrobacter marinus]|nr:DUF2268 domain-containing putative Zn-dependent protease [Rubrobacter marinus]
MRIEAIDVLSGQEAALRAPEGTREEVYRQRVDEPLRRFWEPMMRYMPGGAAGGDDAPSGTALLGFYGPGGDAGEGLDALAKLRDAGSPGACVAALEEAARALAPEEHGVSVESVAFSLALADPRLRDLTERNRGYTGFGGMMGYAAVLVWPDGYNLPRLPSISVHELHHNVRLAFEPWTQGTTVGQYVVLEGLAEAFAAEAVGEELLGPWPNALSEGELEEARPVFRDALEVSGFDEIRGYVFGDWAASRFGYVPRGLPDFAGYAMGYRIVREYLDRTGSTAAEATYVPWREIVDGARYL